MIFWQVLGALVVFACLPVLIPLVIPLAIAAAALGVIVGACYIVYLWPAYIISGFFLLAFVGWATGILEKFEKRTTATRGAVDEII